MKKNTLKTSISYLFSFFFAFFIFALGLVLSTKIMLLNSSSIINAMEKANYYEKTAEEMNEVIVNNARPSGLPIEMFEDYISSVDIKSDMNEYIENAMNNQYSKMNTTKFEKRFSKDVETYLSSESISLNDEEKSAVKTYINQNLEVYRHYSEFPFAKYIGDVVSIFDKIMLVALPFSFIGAIVCAICIRKMHVSKRKTRRFYAYSFIGGGLMLASASLLVFGFRIFEKINLSPEYLYSTMIYIMHNYFTCNLIMGVVFIVLGIIVTTLKANKKQGRFHYIINENLSITD